MYIVAVPKHIPLELLEAVHLGLFLEPDAHSDVQLLIFNSEGPLVNSIGVFFKFEIEHDTNR
jgi:hypothetical protein